MRFAMTCCLLAALLAVTACNKKTTTPTAPPAGGGPPMPMPGMGGGPGMGGMMMASPIRMSMIKLAKGPESLISSMGTDLQAETPDWGGLAMKSKESIELVGDMTKAEPRRGSKESWAKHTTTFSEMMTTLDKMIEKKDKVEAQAAHQTVTSSCKSCHDEHRGGGPGGGKGGFGPGGGGGKGKKGGPASP